MINETQKLKEKIEKGLDKLSFTENLGWSDLQNQNDILSYNFLQGKLKGFNETLKSVGEEIDELIARSGFEMLIAKRFYSELQREFYMQGVKEMEEVWHDILKEFRDELQIPKKNSEVKGK